MATETNPYAAPRADVNAGVGGQFADAGSCWRSGPILMTRHTAVLPARCVKCNGDAQGSLMKRRFYWHPPAWFVLVLLNVIIYAVIAIIVRRRAEVSFGLCATHKQQRRRGVIMVVGVMLLSIGLMAVGVTNDQPILIPMALLGFLVSIVIGVVKARTLLPVRIDAAGAQFKGCGEAFLASLPGS